MGRKPHVTRTFAPLHFEDLEPHRFEDLVRGLMHDYRDWQRIEATGRGGSDDGFDIRAYEKALNDASRETDRDDDEEEPLTVEGDLWMIQCKREKKFSAARITSIIDEAVNKDAPPYGYVLAAPVNFTKRSYDAFRAALVDRGVSEFQLLGRAELEDMLYQPKNDRVLFAFFGISLTSRRRSKITNIRNVVNIKNRLFKVLDSSIDLVDREGDADYRMPHVFVEFGKEGPFGGYWQFLTRYENDRVHVDDFERVSIFPEKFPEPRYGEIYRDRELPIPSYLWHRLRIAQHCFFDFENGFAFLQQRDVIRVRNPETRNDEKSYVEVMYRFEGTVSEVLKLDRRFEFEMNQQINRKPGSDERVTLLQLKTVYEFSFAERNPSSTDDQAP